ncbi:MAG: IS30 family transposase [Neisseriaceae bacterium]|nr:IS30 family transposase [Neisseriaceae bacterium]
MPYNHLTEEGKYHIRWYLDNGFTLRQIAAVLGRSVSTISREIKRCLSFGFAAYIADYKDKIEKVSKRKAYKLKGNLLKTVKYLLKKKFSPEQISGWLLVKKGIKISHMAIKTKFITNSKINRYTKKNCELRQKTARKTSVARFIFLSEWA